ncbi:hypothetical protein Dimus_005842, partial [Dionaea muscipula]
MKVPPAQVVEQEFQIVTSSLELTPSPKDPVHELLISGEDLSPSPSIEFAFKMTNDSAWMWVSCDAKPSALVEFNSSINCDGELFEMCDEVTCSPFVELHDLVPHMIDSWSGQALD